MVSPLKTEFLFQHTLLNIPFNAYDEFLPPNVDDIPPCLQCYAVALHNNRSLWNDDEAISSLCRKRGFKKHKIFTFISFIHILRNTYQLWDTNNINSDNFLFSTLKQNVPFDLNSKQTLFLLTVTERMHILLHSDDLPFHFKQHSLPIYFITGMDGTRKTTAVRAAIYRFLLN